MTYRIEVVHIATGFTVFTGSGDVGDWIGTEDGNIAVAFCDHSQDGTTAEYRNVEAYVVLSVTVDGIRHNVERAVPNRFDALAQFGVTVTRADS